MASPPSNPTVDLDVVFVASEEDAHCQTVASHLSPLRTAYLNLGVLRKIEIDVANDGIELWFPGQDPVRVSSSTTVWWRRPGSTPTSDLDDEEAQLVVDENLQVLIGALDAVGVHWLDHPDVVSRSERKLYQLAVARSLGIPTPSTVVTNRLESAQTFSNTHPVVTKALSPGVGIAPFTSSVESSKLHLVENNPSLIQERITASADLRVVVVGREARVWQRPRGSAVDWRAEEPDGHSFSLVDSPVAVVAHAVALTVALGLTSSVQDWLETRDGPVFLEVNPQGNWLFLPAAETVLAPLFARLVAGDPPLSTGSWPGPWRRFVNDFRPSNKAHPRDGIEAPEWLPPAEIRVAAEWEGSVDLARRAHDAAALAVSVGEAKASRLLQTSLALVVLGLALIPLQFSSFSLIGKALTALPFASVVLLSIAALEASQIDRVGIYSTPRLSDLKGKQLGLGVAVVEAEERGRFMARWTADHKLTELLNAHAWFTRGLTALILSGLVAAVTFGFNVG